MNPANHTFYELFKSLCKPGQDPTVLALTFDEVEDPTDPTVHALAGGLVRLYAEQETAWRDRESTRIWAILRTLPQTDEVFEGVHFPDDVFDPDILNIHRFLPPYELTNKIAQYAFNYEPTQGNYAEIPSAIGRLHTLIEQVNRFQPPPQLMRGRQPLPLTLTRSTCQYLLLRTPHATPRVLYEIDWNTNEHGFDPRQAHGTVQPGTFTVRIRTAHEAISRAFKSIIRDTASALRVRLAFPQNTKPYTYLGVASLAATFTAPTDQPNAQTRLRLLTENAIRKAIPGALIEEEAE